MTHKLTSKLNQSYAQAPTEIYLNNEFTIIIWFKMYSNSNISLIDFSKNNFGNIGIIYLFIYLFEATTFWPSYKGVHHPLVI